MKNIQACFLLVAVVLLSACATTGPLKLYEGAERPAGELVQIQLPAQVEVMSVDGRTLPSQLLRKDTQLALLPGEHVLGLRYVDIFQITADQHEVVRSKQAALRFSGEQGTIYRLTSKVPKNLEEAKRFASKPEFSLLNEKEGGSAITSTPIQSYAEATLLDTIQKAFSKDEKVVTGNIELLKDIWGRSTAEERKTFKEWLLSTEK